MQRFYANLLGARPGLSRPLRKVEALAEAKTWLLELRRADMTALVAKLSDGVARGAGAPRRPPAAPVLGVPAGAADDRLYAHPYYWAAFVLVGDRD